MLDFILVIVTVVVAVWCMLLVPKATFDESIPVGAGGVGAYCEFIVIFQKTPSSFCPTHVAVDARLAPALDDSPIGQWKDPIKMLVISTAPWNLRRFWLRGALLHEAAEAQLYEHCGTVSLALEHLIPFLCGSLQCIRHVPLLLGGTRANEIRLYLARCSIAARHEVTEAQLYTSCCARSPKVLCLLMFNHGRVQCILQILALLRRCRHLERSLKLMLLLGLNTCSRGCS